MAKTIVLLGVVALLAACGKSSDTATSQSGSLDATSASLASCPEPDDTGYIEIAPGLTATILKTGYGRAAVNGDYADTNVKLWLFDPEAPDQRGKFIWESGANVFQFQLGGGQVIKGWDLGVPCMIEGEQRELVVAGNLAYGASGRGEIPPNATLIFDIELLKLTTPE